jgi:iron complex outermembrane recepter protein
MGNRDCSREKLNAAHRCAWILAGLSGAAAAHAQDSSPGAPTADSGGLEEVVVTATKREQSLNSVGLTVDVLGADALSERKLTTLADIASAVPGLTLSAGPTNAPVLTLRGVGFYDRTLAAIPSVSLYLDQTPLPYSAMAAQTAFDLERIEVLKGPQGTLFGESSTGGAINYIAAKPTNTQQAAGDLSYGSYNTTELNAFVSGPLSDTLKARLAVHSVHGDDWQHSYVRPGDTLGKTDVNAARLLVDWLPIDNLHLQLDVNGWRDGSDPQAPQLVSVAPPFPATANPGFLAEPLPPRDPRAADWTPKYRPQADNSLWQTSLRADLGLPGQITLTSLSSYADYSQNLTPGGDGVTASVQDNPFANGYLKSFSQEVRLANSSDAQFRWVGGANLERNRTYENDLVDFSDVSVAPVFNFKGDGARGTQNTLSYAGFANGELDLTHSLTLKGGARFTENENKADICAYDDGDGLTNALFTGIGRAFPGNAGRPALGPSDCFAILSSNGNYGGAPFRDTLREHNVSWQGGLDYKFAPGKLAYVNVSKGYKAGSFPISPLGFERQFQPVTQESVIAYEGGLKLSALDHRLQINAAGYYYDYINKQVTSKINDPVFAVIDALVNIPKSSVKGGELEVTAAPVRGLTLDAQVQYTDAKIVSYVGVNGAAQPANFAGDEIPFISKWQASGGVEYKLPVSMAWQPFVGTNVTYRSSSVAIIGADQPFPAVLHGDTQPFRIGGYTLVDVRGGFESDDGKYRLFLWGKNVFNTFYAQNVYLQYDDVVRLTGRGAVWGATFAVKFN